MGAKKDANEVLLFLYRKYNLQDFTESNSSLAQETGWDNSRVGNSVLYLSEKNLVETIDVYGDDYPIVRKLTSDAIDIIEDKGKFKTTFGFEINLGVIRFSWDIGEK